MSKLPSIRRALATLVYAAILLACLPSARAIQWDPQTALAGHGPDVAVSANALHVVRSDANSPALGHVIYTRSTDGGAMWTGEYTMPASPVARYGSARVSADGGLVAVAWTEDVAGSGEQRVAYSQDEGLTWSATTSLGEGEHTHSIAVSGSAIVAMYAVSGGAWPYSTRVSHDGGLTWEQARPVTGISGVTGDVAISGSAMIALGGVGVGMAAASSADWGATWDTPVTLGTYTNGEALQLSAYGCVVLAAWAQNDNTERYAARSDDSGVTWETAVDVSAGAPGINHGGGVDVHGNFALSTWRHDGAFYWSESDDGGDTWGAAQPGPTVAGVGAVAVDASYAYALNTDSPSGSLWVTRAAAPALPSIRVTGPTPLTVFPEATTSVALAVDLVNHAAPAYWAWSLSPFPDSGPAGGTLVTSGAATTVTGLTDGATYTVYVALVDEGGVLLDPSATHCETFSIAGVPPAPAVTIVEPAADQALAAGVTSTPLTVTITDYPAPGHWHWHWQLDTPFHDTGVAGGNHVDPGVLTDTIAGLSDGTAYSVYVALVDGSENLLSPSVTASAPFSVTDAGPLADAVTVVDAQGAAGQAVQVQIQLYDLAPEDELSGVFLSLAYDPALLTPTDDGAGAVTAASTGDIVPEEWTIEQNVPAPGALNVSMAGDLGSAPITTGGILLNVDFVVDVDAAASATSPLTLTALELNEGLISSTPVHGTFTVLDLLYGDVTGNGKAGAYDAAWILHFAVDFALDPAPPVVEFPVETATPVWASEPLLPEQAWEVADVDDSGAPQAQPADIMAMDASMVLQHEVGLTTAFPAESGGPAAPAQLASVAGHVLRGESTSERPGGRIAVSLDVSAAADLVAGEVVLDFDASLVTPVDTSLATTRTRGASRPLIVQRARGGRIATAFASARPLDASDAVLEVTFEASRNVAHATESAIRASHLRLNASRVETDFAFPFRIEPFANRLMANYPNPFNPETWIPFELAADAHVTVGIYDLAGHRVRALDLGMRPMGEHTSREDAAHWDGRNAHGEHVASGVYVYELTAGEYRAVRRMIVRK